MSLFDYDEFQPQRKKMKNTKKYLKEMKVGEKIDTYLKVLSVSKRAKKDGNPFLTLEVMDKTAKIPAKVWDRAEYYFNLLQEGEIYKINGLVNEYMSQKEIKIDGIQRINPMDKDVALEDFEEQASFDTEQLSADLLEILKKNLNNKHLLKLVESFTAEYYDNFKVHYGAQKVHHAYIGGLLQHTHSMMKLAVFCAEHYSLDKELLLIGVLFHDVGKMFEFTVSPTVNSTFEGGMIGHLVIGNNIFIQLKNKIPDFPEDLSYKIQHMIISHHGEKEFGSPEVPKMPEAFVLHILDLLDSKLKIVEETLENNETKGLFTDYIKVLGRRLYAPQKENE